MGMRLYKRGWQSPKWKEPRTFNVETQVQANAHGVRVKEGMGLGWSQGVWIGWVRCLIGTLMMN